MYHIDYNSVGMNQVTFLICSIRNATPEQRRKLENIVSGLMDAGYRVYYPLWHTNQEDFIGLRICADNRKAIINSDVVHINFSPASRGTLFDLGMAYSARKSLYFINVEEFIDVEESGEDYSDLVKFIFEYSDNVDYDGDSRLLSEMERRLVTIRNNEIAEYTWNEGDDRNPEFLIDFGMAFMDKGLAELSGGRKYITLANPDEVEITTKINPKTGEEELRKSFQNVLLALTYEHMRGSRKIADCLEPIKEMNEYLDLSAYVRDLSIVPA